MTRAGYHHGNLRADALASALRQVSAGGMGALAAREVAREVGVTPAALYRHFEDVAHLRADVSQQARQALARAMIAARDAVPARRDRVRCATERFEATGAAYVRFAVAEPGLFDAAFASCGALPDRPDDPSARVVLEQALDDLAAVGVLPADRRPEAPLISWAAVHGLATLVQSSELPPDFDVDAAIGIVVRGVGRALGLS